MLIQIEQLFPSLTWRIRQEAMYPLAQLDFVKLEDDFEGIHFGLYADHQLTGVVSLFHVGSIYQFRKLAILPKAQKLGLGTQLMHYLIDFCQIQKATKLWCNARTNAIEFYYKFGFYETEKKFTKDGFDFVVIEKNL